MSESPETTGYPAALDTWSNLTDKEDLAEVSDINKLKNAVTAMQTESGTDVAGSATDLKSRLAVTIANDGAIQNGTSYPVSPVANQQFTRTDEDISYRRNAANTAWLAIGGGHSRLSTTTIASGTNSGNITIESDKQYLIRFVILNNANAINQIYLAFNDSGATVDMSYWKEERKMHGTPTITTTGSTGTTVDIPLGSLDELNGVSSSGQMWGVMNLDTTRNTNTTGNNLGGMATITGCYQKDDAAWYSFSIQAVIILTAALSSFEFLSSSSQNFTGTVWLYELSLI